MDRWLSLDEIARESISRVGGKAWHLATLRRAGAPVLPGWVLPAGVGPETAAEALRGRAPEIGTWIMRSSSPLEDRVGGSAAGLFASVVCEADQLQAAIEQVIASGEGEEARRILGRSVPLAVLAQPYLRADLWLAVECRRDGQLSAEGSRLGRALEPDEALAELETWTDWRKQCHADDDVLLELLRQGEDWWLLQLRPAPAESLVGSGRWRADSEHCVRPLCPLFASLLESLSGTDTRLVAGVWYERERSIAAPDEAQLEALLDESERTLRECERRTEELRALRPVRPEELLEFFDRWTDLNRQYFSRPTARLRTALRDRQANPGALRRSIAARRGAELAALEGPPGPELLERHGHVSRWPWDGRSPCAWEDPTLLEELRGSDFEAPPASDSTMADRIALHLENDDECLARLYAVLRVTVRHACFHGGLPEGRWEEALELDSPTLLALLPRIGGKAWQEAVAEGRARAARWAASLRQSEASGSVGIGVVPGRARGRLCRRRYAREHGLPEPGVILAVDSISPFDSVVFPRLAALLVGSGDRLGHASILAREHGVPTIVGLGRLPDEFADGVLVQVDAMEGVVALG